MLMKPVLMMSKMLMKIRMKPLAAALAALATCGVAAGQEGAEQRQQGPRSRARVVGPQTVNASVAGAKGRYLGDESAREDRVTGGRVESAKFAPGEPDVRVTVDVPAFRLTLWQNGKEVKTYRVGVGMKDYPISISERRASEIIWNPAWVPPDSDWVGERKGVKVGEVIKASDPRNPLGKMKIPLGGGYLIHEAHGAADLGNLVSHGCVRMMRADLYDLAEKIVAARSLPVTAKEIARAKQTKRTLVAKLDEPLVVDVNYDTHVVEEGQLHLFADVYGRGTNTPAMLRASLEEYGVDASSYDDEALKKLLALPTRQRQYVVGLESVSAGRALEDGRFVPIIPRAAAPARTAKKKARAA
jgi:lipoprotein-anchoring transpeptidase ErfK/SrfK